MIKRIFIPLVAPGQSTGDLLELYVEPCWLKPKFCFSQLANAGLNQGIAFAKQALTQLQIQTGKGMIYSSRQQLLTSSRGTATGLVLASVISLQSCPYQTVIVSATLEDDPLLFYPLKYNGFWLERLSGVLTLSRQENKVPFILPPDTLLTAEQNMQLISLNIYPVLIPNLRQAIDFCLTSTRA